MRNINATLLDSSRTSIFGEHQCGYPCDLVLTASSTVAHRLRTISDCDIIFVLRGGRVMEQGTHSMLLARDGLYRDLWDSQSTIGIGQGAGEGEELPEGQVTVDDASKKPPASGR